MARPIEILRRPISGNFQLIAELSEGGGGGVKFWIRSPNNDNGVTVDVNTAAVLLQMLQLPPAP